ncbi:MAG: hypothetical protein R6U88_05830 [Candidatus Bipolaricaulota bacterium]
MRKLLITLAALGALGMVPAGAVAEDLDFGGSLGLEFTFTPIPPADVDISTDITLSLSFADAQVISRTRLTWDGLQEAWLSFGLDLKALELISAMRFDPCFSMYRLQAWGEWCPAELGGLVLLENLAAPCEPADYTVGVVLDLGLNLEYGFWLRSLTGFGVWDLYYLVDDLVRTDLSPAPGWWFEEQLLGIGLQGECFSVDSWILFTDLGLNWAHFGSAYRWTEPDVEVGTRLWWTGGMAFDSAELIVAGTINPVTLRSVTVFDLGGFVMQEIDIEVAFSGITIYSQTMFDFVGLLQQVAGIELRF